jgi:hypothetical protein
MSGLFEQIEREHIGNQQEWNKRQQLHLPLIDAFSQANDPYEMRSQLIAVNGVASLCSENSQASELPDPFIRCRTGFMEESSRFNYGYDMAINKRKIDVSGQLIPNGSAPYPNEAYKYTRTKPTVFFHTKLTSLNSPKNYQILLWIIALILKMYHQVQDIKLLTPSSIIVRSIKPIKIKQLIKHLPEICNLLQPLKQNPEHSPKIIFLYINKN